MNLSQRLQHIVNIIPKCLCLADIGTDHGYIPIYAIQNNICSNAIASDINEGPIKIANKNIRKYKVSDRIQTRIGSGLSSLKINEADVILIAGMGGNLIADIIDDDIEISKSASYLILQPMQYPEVLRQYLVNNGFNIIDEDLVKDENKYYHIIKAVVGESGEYPNNSLYYTGLKLIEKKHPLIKDYINYNLERIDIILKQMINSTNADKYKELIQLKENFEEVLKCL